MGRSAAAVQRAKKTRVVFPGFVSKATHNEQRSVVSFVVFTQREYRVYDDCYLWGTFIFMLFYACANTTGLSHHTQVGHLLPAPVPYSVRRVYLNLAALEPAAEV